MTVRDAFLQVLRIIAAMVAILFVINFPPSCSSPCHENPRGEEVCDVYGEYPLERAEHGYSELLRGGHTRLNHRSAARRAARSTALH
jgi:hypothetical protein